MITLVPVVEWRERPELGVRGDAGTLRPRAPHPVAAFARVASSRPALLIAAQRV